jgi:serine/threonine protein kinase
MPAPASLITFGRNRFGTPVARKRLRPDDAGREDLALRLANEMAVLEYLDGTPGVIRLLDIDRDPLTLVLEWADGGSLQDRLESGLPEEERRAVATALVAAVAACHARAVVHRDIKPSNLLFVGGTLRLADFGVAAWGTPRRALPEGWEEGPVGTPPWSAPELRQGGTGRVDESIDVYGVAMTLDALLGRSARRRAARSDDPRQRPTLVELGATIG